MEPLEFWGLLGVPIVMAAVEGVKRVWTACPDRFLPLWALVFGIVLQVYIAWTQTMPLDRGIFTGIIVALAAMGLYSGAKKLSNN